MDAPTDETLLRDFIAGQSAGFELLARRHASEVYQFVLRYTRNSAAAEDVVQETFLQLYTSADRFDQTRRVKPWLFTIAANKARDHLRRRARKREVPLDAQVCQEDESGQRFADLIAEDETPPDTDLNFEERRRVVRGIVDAMPDKLSEVLVLAYFHRLPYRDIAEVLDVPLGTVKSRLHAAIVHFGERYRAVARERSLEQW